MQACVTAAVPPAYSAFCCTKHVAARGKAEAEGQQYAPEAAESAQEQACGFVPVSVAAWLSRACPSLSCGFVARAIMSCR
jgi:hypothetical protein